MAQMKAHSCGYEILPHTHYSPDLAPSNFYRFPTMTSYLKGEHFSDDYELIYEVKAWLQTHLTNFYQRSLHRGTRWWEKCVSIGGMEWRTNGYDKLYLSYSLGNRSRKISNEHSLHMCLHVHTPTYNTIQTQPYSYYSCVCVCVCYILLLKCIAN